MPNWVNNTITANGTIAIAAAMAGTQLVITRVAVGSGIAAGQLFSQTALTNQQMNLVTVPPQVSANVVQPGEIVITATLDSAHVGATFSLTELGVFATSGSGPEQLIAYCQASSPYDSIATGSGPSRLQVIEQIPIVVGVGASVNITVVAGNPIFIPPVVAGPGIAVAAPTDSLGNILEWIVSTPTIVNSTTLFVALGNNNVAPNFSSIPNAMSYLSGFSIPSNVRITISVAAGTYTGSTVYISHVNASQIYISGPKNTDQSFTSAAITGGSQGNWTMVLSGVPNTAQIVVGGWIIIWAVSGLASWGEVICAGYYPVRAKTANTVTITNTFFRSTTFPAITGMVGTFTPITAFLSPTQGTTGMTGVQIVNGIGGFSYIGINPNVVPPANTYAHGLLVSGGYAVIDHCGAYAFQNNTQQCAGFYSVNNSTPTFQYCASIQCNNGFTNSGAQAAIIWCASCHHTSAGLYADTAGIFVIDPNGQIASSITWIGGNGGNGIQLYDGSYLVLQGIISTTGANIGGSAYVAFNAGWGLLLSFQARGNSSFPSTINTTTLQTNFNAAGDLTVIGLSISNVARGGTANLSQAVGTLTAGGVILI
jgi:hypothetical protein